MLDLLDEYKLTDNTIVIFISDNGGAGGASNAPLKGKKATVWEGGLRVCGTIRYPGKIPAGTVNDEFLTSMDLFPTLLNLAGAKPPESVILDGSDCLDTLAGKASSPRHEMFWKRRDQEAARVGNWKWVRNGGEASLYDLSQDIGEKHDLSKSNPKQAAEMQQRFEKWLAEMDAAEPRGPFKDY